MKSAAKDCRNIFACLTVAMIIAAWLIPAGFAVNVEEANAVISQAETDIGSAYAVVADAETAGVDISALLNQLSSAGDSLSRAYVAFGTGEYANASALAIECSRALDGVTVTAASLKAEAEKAHSDRLLFSMVGSSVGLVLLLVFGFLGWKLLKKRYFKRILDMKPQMEGAQ